MNAELQMRGRDPVLVKGDYPVPGASLAVHVEDQEEQHFEQFERQLHSVCRIHIGDNLGETEDTHEFKHGEQLEVPSHAFLHEGLEQLVEGDRSQQVYPKLRLQVLISNGFGFRHLVPSLYVNVSSAEIHHNIYAKAYIYHVVYYLEVQRVNVLRREGDVEGEEVAVPDAEGHDEQVPADAQAAVHSDQPLELLLLLQGLGVRGLQ